jgi:hypothetical protein
VTQKKSNIALQRVAHAAAALISAASLAVSSEAVAQSRYEAADALNAPHTCWVVQRFIPGRAAFERGFWENVGAVGPGTDPRFREYSNGRLDDYGLPPAIYPKNPGLARAFRLARVPCDHPRSEMGLNSPWNSTNAWHVGGFVGGAMVTGLPTTSSSGFFTGNLDNTPAAWGVGGSAFIDVARFGTSPAWFGSVVLSTGLVVDYFSGASLQYHGGCGGFACMGTGGLSELNYIAEIKATTPLSPGNTLNGYIGAGGATLFPTGQPTGAGGPNFVGSATAPAFRVGWGVDHQLDTNWSAGFKVGFQHTGSTEYDTTLAGERFRIDHKNEVLLGATFTYTPGP